MTELDNLGQEVLDRLRSCLDIDESSSDMEEARREIVYGLARAEPTICLGHPSDPKSESEWRETMRGEME